MNLEVDLLIVGAGFYGATIAEQVSAAGKNVLIIDRRQHIGGNAYTETDVQTGIERHVYGAHLFHTSNKDVWDYLNRFTAFTNYVHRVYTIHRGRVFQMPINLGTICQHYNKVLSPDEASELIREDSSEFSSGEARNLEEKAISLIGRPLYEAFIRDYTRKQWQTSPVDLPAHIITRLPVRYSFDNRYFNDTYEGLPSNGYTAIFERMLSSPLINVHLGVDFFDLRRSVAKLPKVLFTGPIDRYFEYTEGMLGWRTVDFEWERPDVKDYQGTSVMNYADIDCPWTRIIEFKHFHPDRIVEGRTTLIAKEFSRRADLEDEPYYPIGTTEDKNAYRRYRAKADSERDVRFGGRLGTYKYLDMHQAIGAALKDAGDILSWLSRDEIAAA